MLLKYCKSDDHANRAISENSTIVLSKISDLICFLAKYRLCNKKINTKIKN